MEDIVKASLRDHLAVIQSLEAMVPQVVTIAEVIIASLRSGGRLYCCGNGGSAADAQHLVAELIGRFRRERPGLPAIALTTDSSVLTAIGNDFAFDLVFSRQVAALCRPGDVLLCLSTSGNSPNVLAALRQARELGTITVGFGGRGGGQMAALCDHTLIVAHQDTARIQEAYLLMGHIICDLIDAAFAPGPATP